MSAGGVLVITDNEVVTIYADSPASVEAIIACLATKYDIRYDPPAQLGGQSYQTKVTIHERGNKGPG